MKIKSVLVYDVVLREVDSRLPKNILHLWSKWSKCPQAMSNPKIWGAEILVVLQVCPRTL